MAVVTERCKSCIYYCNCDGHYIIPTCDYFLKTGKLRGCPAGDECDKYIPSEECLKFTSAALGTIRLPIKKQLMLDLYEQGLNDAEISRSAGVSRKTVVAWRNKCGLPSNAVIGGEVLDED